MNIRLFSPRDAEFCFKVRSKAFIEKFYDELNAEEVAACVNAYMPDDYIKIAKEIPFFVVEENGILLGFFTIKRKNFNTAELPLIYVDLDNLCKDIGSACIKFLESWIALNWKEVDTLIVDTVIPKNNSGFYEKVGFIPAEETFCDFPELSVRALRLIKKLNASYKLT